jgi:hypothetical protein
MESTESQRVGEGPEASKVERQIAELLYPYLMAWAYEDEGVDGLDRLTINTNKKFAAFLANKLFVELFSKGTINVPNAPVDSI